VPTVTTSPRVGKLAPPHRCQNVSRRKGAGVDRRGSPRTSTSPLSNATDSQIGDLGEETAPIYLAEVDDATIVTMGDSGQSRSGGRQDLDLVAFIDGELIVPWTCPETCWSC